MYQSEINFLLFFIFILFYYNDIFKKGHACFLPRLLPFFSRIIIQFIFNNEYEKRYRIDFLRVLNRPNSYHLSFRVTQWHPLLHPLDRLLDNRIYELRGRMQ